MATVDLGKIKFTWRGAYATGDTYEADDVVSYGGSSWVYINSSSATGSAAGAPSTTNTTYWDLMADGTNPLTTQGDVMTHDGTNAIRLARGNNGEVLTVSGSDLTFSAISALQGRKFLQKNYDNVANPSATNTYGASGSECWLADYDNDWIPECGIPNPAMSPVSWWDGTDVGGYRKHVYLNENHEVVMAGGADTYYWAGNSTGNAHDKGIKVNISPEFGGLEEGEYFVRIWLCYSNIYCVTNKGGLFAAGYNGYGQLGVGDTTDRYNLVRVPAFGEGRTHGSGADNGMRIAGFHANNGGNGYGNYTRCFAIDENGRLFSWGHNGGGQLGIGNQTNQTRPQEVTAITNAKQIHTSYLTTFVVDGDGDLFNCGYNANGLLGGVTISAYTNTFTQVSGASNVYQFGQTTHTYYTTSWTYTGTSHYLNTSGELYGSGYAGNGQLGDGTTTQKNAYARIGGSSTYSSIYYAGQSRDLSIYCLGGTPGSSDKDLDVFGYNGTGNLAMGNTTNQTSPQRPTTTSIYSYTSSSTQADSAPTTTSVAFPRDDIEEVFPCHGMQGQSTNFAMCIDNTGKVWRSGYSQSQDYWQNNTGNTNLTSFRLEPAMFNTAETTTGKFWLGETQRSVVAIRTQGYSYNSEGIALAYFSDGTILAMGYNGQGQIDSNQQYIGNWNQIN